MTECYVCYEPCKNPAPCLCKTMYVHETCITILRMYGKTECGICRTSFDNSVPVDMVLDIPPPAPPLPPRILSDDEDEDSLEEQPTLRRPPFLCYFLCVPCRCGNYLVTEADVACDSLRILLALFTAYIFISLYSSTIIPDFFLFAVIAMMVLGVCNALSHKQVRRRRRSGR